MSCTVSATSNALTMDNYTPVNTVAPVISGTAVVGQTLSTTNGTWSNSPTYSYQWKRGATNIGTNSSTYTLVQADAGNTSNITCVVTATNTGGSANATSNQIAQILTVRTNSFLTASAISDTTIRGALNTLDVGLISNSLDTKMKALYPFVGGTASTHKFNFMNAADTNAAFRLSFSGTWTHDSLGAQPNGVNGYADTNINTSINLIKTNAHISLYVVNNPAVGARYDMGNASNAAMTVDSTYLITRYNANSVFIGIGDNSYATASTTTDSRAFWSGGANGSSTQILYKNGVSIASASQGAGTLSNINLYIGAANAGGITSFYSDKKYAFGSIGTGLSATDTTNYYNLVQSFQTTLGRQV